MQATYPAVECLRCEPDLTVNVGNLVGFLVPVRGNPLHAVVTGREVFSLKGQKLYDLRGVNIYKLNGDLVGHLSDANGTEKRLDKATDRLFPAP